MRLIRLSVPVLYKVDRFLGRSTEFLIDTQGKVRSWFKDSSDLNGIIVNYGEGYLEFSPNKVIYTSDIKAGKNYKPNGIDKLPSPEFIRALYQRHIALDPYAKYGVYMDQPSALDFDLVLTLVDYEAEIVRTIKSPIISPVFFEGKVLCIQQSNKAVIALDDKLEVLWESEGVDLMHRGYRGSARAGGIVCSGVVAVFQSKARKEETQARSIDFPEAIYKDSTLYCLKSGDGKLLWEASFKYAIDDFLIHENKIFVYTFNQVHILNAASGELEHIIDNGRTRTIYKACARPPELFIADGLLYMPWHDDSCIFVYRLSDYSLAGVIELPAGHHVMQWQLHDESTGQIYVTLHNRNEGFDFHRESLLQFHPNEIGQSIEIEQGPKTQIILKPCGDGKQSLWVEMESPSLDDALRFGELHTQNHAFIHGHSQIDRNPPTEDFNGQVHFVLTGCTAPETEIQEKLEIMRKRFNHWADKEGIIAGGRSQDCELFVEFN